MTSAGAGPVQAIRAVIFDFGGVLVPGTSSVNDPDSRDARLERQHGLPPGYLWRAVYIENPGWLRLRVGEGSVDEWLGAAREFIARDLPGAAADAIMAAIEETRPQGARLSGRKPEFVEGMLHLVRRLQGRYRLAILSNAAPGLEDELREHYQIAGLFDDIVNSATVRMAKPDPRIYRLSATRLGVPITGCFFTDDLEHNVESARREGMTAHQFMGCEGLMRALDEAGVAFA